MESWRPGELDTAATAVGEASTKVDEQARSLSRTLEQALTEARGYWAMAASERAAEEARTGARLADALDLARAALRTGATDIGHARTQLLDTIAGAEAEGFSVGEDGSVTAPTLPPVLTSPENGAAAAADRNAEQGRLNDRAGALAADIGAALTGVGTADAATGEALGGIDIPQTLESAVEAYIERAITSRDLLGALGTAGGAVALGLVLKKSVGLFGRSRSFLDFLRASSAPITDYQTFLRNMGASDDALRAFMNGKADGGLARFLIGSRAARIAGKVFLPLTVATGAFDAVTGGGYDGARGWATRGFGLAGAAGGGALLASSAGLIHSVRSGSASPARPSSAMAPGRSATTSTTTGTTSRSSVAPPWSGPVTVWAMPTTPRVPRPTGPATGSRTRGRPSRTWGPPPWTRSVSGCSRFVPCQPLSPTLSSSMS